MQYAIVDGQRREALPGLLGTCSICDAVLRPKCGRIRVAHWAHPPGSVDHRWEPESEWHRNWKERFPVECREVVHHASNGERHFADVKTVHGRVLEFQNSPISEQERRSREELYRPMWWIVNGQRLKLDRPQFFKLLRYERIMRASPLKFVVPVESCVLLQKWADSRVTVLFDFGETEDEGDIFRFGAPVLWASDPKRSKGTVVLRPVYRKSFVESVIENKPLKGINFVKVLQRVLRLSVPQVTPVRPHRWKPHRPSFRQSIARKHRARARKRF